MVLKKDIGGLWIKGLIRGLQSSFQLSGLKEHKKKIIYLIEYKRNEV